MEQSASLMHDFCQFRHGLNGADFIVGEHSGHQQDVFTQSGLQGFRLDNTHIIYRKRADSISHPFQRNAAVQYSMMLYGARNQAFSAIILEHSSF